MIFLPFLPTVLYQRVVFCIFYSTSAVGPFTQSQSSSISLFQFTRQWYYKSNKTSQVSRIKYPTIQVYNIQSQFQCVKSVTDSQIGVEKRNQNLYSHHFRHLLFQVFHYLTFFVCLIYRSFL